MAGQTGNKQVTKKQQLEALKNTIYVNYSLPSDAPATKPGWIGKWITGLLKRVFSVTELLWDEAVSLGWAVGAPHPPCPFSLMASLDPRTSYLTGMALS